MVISCSQKQPPYIATDIAEVVYGSNNIIFNLTANFYVLDSTYLNNGRKNLYLTDNEIFMIKDYLIKNQIYDLKNANSFLQNCSNKPCKAEFFIKYKSDKKQHFIFDNYLYKNNNSNLNYHKIVAFEEYIAKIIMKKKLDPQPKKVSC